MSNPDINTVKELDLDFLRKAEHYRVGDKVIVRVGNSDSGEPLLVTLDDNGTVEDFSLYGEANAVGVNDLTTVLAYIIPVGKVLELDNIEVSGTNYACYTVSVDGSTNKVRRTNTGSSLNDNFSYNKYRIAAGLELKIEVIHNQDLGHAGDFNATIEGKLRDA